MRIRLALPFVAAALVASPALAQDRGPGLRDMDADRAAALLSNPAVQDGLAAVLSQFTDAFLETRVGPMAALTNPRDDVRSSDTLRDVLRRDDPDFDRKLRRNTRRSLAIAGGAARGAAEMSRELRATTERLRAVLDRVDNY